MDIVGGLWRGWGVSFLSILLLTLLLTTNLNEITQPEIVTSEDFAIRGNPYNISKEIDELGRIVLKLDL
jgi:hypothetical protein